MTAGNNTELLITSPHPSRFAHVDIRLLCIRVYVRGYRQAIIVGALQALEIVPLSSRDAIYWLKSILFTLFIAIYKELIIAYFSSGIFGTDVF
jgi:hypothetical protein